MQTVASAAELAEIAETTEDKHVRKAARAALYRLKQRGVVAPERLHQQEAPAEIDRMQAYATGFDGAGNRILFFLRHDPDGGKPTLIQIFFNDEEGLRGSDSLRCTAREAHERLAKFTDETAGLAFAEIEADYGRWLLEEVRQFHRARNIPTHNGFLSLLSLIGDPRSEHTPAVYAVGSAESIATDPATIAEAGALFALPWFDAWFFSESEVEPWLRAWEELLVGIEEVDDDALERRREQIISAAASTIMTPAVRNRYIRRLEETGDIVRRCGEDAAARLAIYHAWSMKSDAPAVDIPFVRALARRTLGAVEHEEPADAASGRAAVLERAADGLA